MDVMRPNIDWSVCQSCIPCEAQLVCQTHAIVRPDREEPPWIAYERCSRCNQCVQACAYGVISLQPGFNQVGCRR